MPVRRKASKYVVRVRRSDQFPEGEFTWEICRLAYVNAELMAGRGFMTEAEARSAGDEALSVFNQV